MAAQIELELYPIARNFDAAPTTYCPNEPIAGHIRLDPQGNTKARRVLLSLYWHTEGRGDKDKATGHKETLHEGDLPSQPLEFDFSFPAPRSPWSYAGTLLHIHWSLEVRIDVPFGRDTVETRRIHILPISRLQPQGILE